jgi:hypothetical protein
MSVKIDMKLTSPELMQAALCGSMRRITAMKDGMDTDCNCRNPKTSWATDIDGAASEMAVSKYLRRYWSGHVRNFTGDDVLGGIQVRSTVYEQGKLILRPDDPDDAFFILVVANAPIYSIRGGIFARDGKIDAYFRPCDPVEGSPAWWVPQDALVDLSALNASKVREMPRRGAA